MQYIGLPFVTSVQFHNLFCHVTCHFCFVGGPQLSEDVDRAKILLGLWRKKFLTFSILFHLP